MQILKCQMQEMVPQNRFSDDDLVYILRSANLTFQVQKSNLTFAFMHFSIIARKSLDVIFEKKVFFVFLFMFLVMQICIWEMHFDIWH